MVVMKTKKVPIRTCIVCHTAQPKKELVRIVRVGKEDVSLMLDVKGKVSGRGAYLCPNPACIQQALKTRRLEKALEVPVTDELAGALLAMAEGRTRDG